MKKTLVATVVFGLVAYMAPSSVLACCGVYPTVESVNVTAECVNEEGLIYGVVKGTEEWENAYSTDAEVTVQIGPPSSGSINITADLSNLQEFPGATPPYATWDYSATYTPTEVGLYTYVVIVEWTSALGWTETNSVSGTFEVDECLTLGKVTGGGWLLSGEAKNTFGFVVKYCEGDEGVSGNVEFQAHGILNLKSTAVDFLRVEGTKAKARGQCTINGEEGYTFKLEVEDNGEPGKGVDTFEISWDQPVEGFSSVGGVIDNGNIQIHGPDEECQF